MLFLIVFNLLLAKKMTGIQAKFSEQEFPQEIIALFTEVEKNPTDLIVKITLASSLEESGYITEALTIYRQIISAEPNSVFAASAQKAIENLGFEVIDLEDIQEVEAETETEEKTIEEISQDISSVNQVKKLLLKPKQFFSNLPITTKQFISLFTSSVISIIGVAATGMIITFMSGRAQLRNQAIAELAVASTNYDNRSESTENGLRGQANNIKIIEVARKYQLDGKLTNQEREEVRKILKNEAQARRLEYVTLVGNDAHIIVNSNRERYGKEFDPNNLVKNILKLPRRVRTNSIVSWQEIVKELPHLSEKITRGDILVKFTFTPVTDPQTNKNLGLLVSGDIVNTNNVEIQKTVKMLGGGYGAVYFRDRMGNYVLATSVLEIKSPKSNLESKVKLNISLTDLSLLKQVEKGIKEDLTKRIKINGKFYTVAVQSLPNFEGKKVAFLLRGTSETALNQLLNNSLSMQLGVAFLTLTFIGILSILIGRTLTFPIRRLRETAQKIAIGDLNARADINSQDEVGELGRTFNDMAKQIDISTQEIANQAIEHQKEVERQRQAREKLQYAVIKLLLEIEQAREGDLTVRATVDDQEVGSIADAFNTTLANLDSLVTQVKVVAEQVHQESFSSGKSVQELSQEAIIQAQEIKSAVQAIQDIASSIESVSKTAEAAAAISHKSRLISQKGQEKMNQTVNSIDNIRSSVADTSKKAKRLAESSQEISKIVHIISEISEKTNLLAFNASIEASRAKEGQGFRIVADEVRRLAEQVTFSAQDIEQLVSGIQSETREMLHMMETSTNEVVKGTQLIEQTKIALQKLARVSEKIDSLLESISLSTVAQRSDSQKVAQKMENLALVSGKTAVDSQSVSSSLDELVKIAKELENSASRFQVSKEKE